MGRLTIKTTSKPAVTITRQATKVEGLVYLGVANRPYKYPGGRSRIIYIGTTKASARRIALSAAHKAGLLLGEHGITHLEFFVVHASRISGQETWKILERALIMTFRDRFGAPPRMNKQGTRMKWRDEHSYFTPRRLEGVIEKYSDAPVR